MTDEADVALLSALEDAPGSVQALACQLYPMPLALTMARLEVAKREGLATCRYHVWSLTDAGRAKLRTGS